MTKPRLRYYDPEEQQQTRALAGVQSNTLRNYRPRSTASTRFISNIDHLGAI